VKNKLNTCPSKEQKKHDPLILWGPSNDSYARATPQKKKKTTKKNNNQHQQKNPHQKNTTTVADQEPPQKT